MNKSSLMQRLEHEREQYILHRPVQTQSPPGDIDDYIFGDTQERSDK